MAPLLDTEKFYDTASWVKLSQIAVREGVPPVVVALEITAFVGPRFLQERTILREAIWSTRSLVAGSARGVGLAKLFLHPILERAHRMAPQSSLWTFVDDTVARQEGSRQAVCDCIIQVTEILTDGLKEQMMKMSNKS
eukprot:9503429-Pyramimonas_sp.AAC.1